MGSCIAHCPARARATRSRPLWKRIAGSGTLLRYGFAAGPQTLPIECLLARNQRPAAQRAAQGLTCTTAVHICYGYGIKANTDWKSTLGDEWHRYEAVFPALAKSSIDQVSLECIHSHVPPDLMKLLAGKDVMVGVIDVASDVVETPEEVADTIGRAPEFVPKERLFPCTNCGLAPMGRDVAWRKLQALAEGKKLAKERLAAA